MDKTSLFKIWKNEYKKVIKEKRHCEFLEDCQHFGLIPKFIRIRNNYLRTHYKETVRTFENNILRKMIRYKHGRLHTLKEKENDIKIEIKNLCDEEEFKILENKIVTIGNIEYNVISNRQNKKLKYWLRNNPQKLKMLNKTSNEIDYINLSSKQMNTHQDSVLKLGPKYILDDNINLKDTIPKIENALEAINTDQRDKLRSIAQEVIKKGLKEKN